MGIFQRSVEAGLISFGERSEVDGVDRRIELLLTFGFAFFVGGDHWTRGKNLQPQEGGIRAILWRIDNEVTMGKLELNVISSDYAGGDQNFLSGLGVFGEQNGFDIVVAAAVDDCAAG